MRRSRLSGALTARIAASAFTIIEILVASTILLLILGVVLTMISQTSSVTRRATDKVANFQGARTAFDIVTQTLSQATLNSYWDYDNQVMPTRYLRTSQLHFLIGRSGENALPGTPGTGQAIFFQAPVGVTLQRPSYGGLEDLLNGCGYYVRYGDDDALPSPFETVPKYRYRLMQCIAPTETLRVYDNTTGNAWVTSLASSALPIADNIICLLVWPRKPPAEDIEGTSLTTDFTYDSRLNSASVPQPVTANQLPPVVQITIVAMDEASASRFCKGASPPSEIGGLLNNLFANSDRTSFERDLLELEGRMANLKINYRLFSSFIPLRESKMQ